MTPLLQSSAFGADVTGVSMVISGNALAALAGALVAAVLSVIIAHGVLRPLLEARGVVPWTVRDTLGSLPLVMIGSALTTGSAVYLAGRIFSANLPLHVLCLALLLAGLLTVRFGLLGLRKLT